MIPDYDPRAGALNLLRHCAGVQPDHELAVVVESNGSTFYDRFAGQCIAETAASLGARVRLLECAPDHDPDDLPKSLLDTLGSSDIVIFQNRIGDRIRFNELSGSGHKVMTYALDIGLLGAPFCTLPHGLMSEILERFEAALNRAASWRITCPLGTDVTGTCVAPGPEASQTQGFTLDLFPIVTFRPVDCRTMRGRVALSRWLMATGHRAYDDDVLMLDQPLFAQVQAGRIVDFEGPAALTKRCRDHYRRVGELFGIDPFVVHSWHSGIHPKAIYPLRAEADIERWGSVAFANPRYTHVHTCGDYAPGEIAWSLFDTTIELDGVPFWKNGRFIFLDRPENQALAQSHGCGPGAFEHLTDIGLS